MIEYRSGDILKSEAEALVNTVNCVGVMGRGIALQFKDAFPENFKAYAAACKREQVQPGDEDRPLHDRMPRAVEADERPPLVHRHHAGLQPHPLLRGVG